MKRVYLLAAPVVLLPVLFASAALSSDAGRPPVIKYKDDQFGAILATPKKQALYYWRVEARRRQDQVQGLVREAVAAADRPPPVRSATPHRRHPGPLRRDPAPGRPASGHHRGLAVYTYAHEQPEQVLCDDVNGWFVVRLR